METRKFWQVRDLAKMYFDDDEEIVLPKEDDSAPKLVRLVEGLVQVRAIRKNEAPVGETNFTVMLELTGAGSGNHRHGVDIVTVLDFSGSMGGVQLDKMRFAMHFLIKKLSPIDRLSVVIFRDKAERLCPLRQITTDSEMEIIMQVNDLTTYGDSNITDGLATALKVINDRKFNTDREVAIVLMSDGEQSKGGDAAKVRVDHVPVHTFSFGTCSGGAYDPSVLNTIAKNSNGGTFSIADAENTITSNLNIVFSQSLAGILTTVVRDLKLKVRKLQSEINEVYAGNYPQTKDEADGSITISFGNLYIKEMHRVIVDLTLPVVSTQGDQDILKYSYSYTAMDGVFDSEAEPGNTVRITRNGTISQPERMEVIAEQKRLETTSMIKEAITLADRNKLTQAKDKLLKAEDCLDNVVEDEGNPMFDMLRYELEQLSSFMQSPDIYKKQGRPFALSSVTSHERQRFAARGDVDRLRFFSTPRMDKYLKQAKSFGEDPITKSPPTVEEDVNEELEDDPLAPMIGPLNYILDTAIESLKAIKDVLNAGR